MWRPRQSAVVLLVLFLAAFAPYGCGSDNESRATPTATAVPPTATSTPLPATDTPTQRPTDTTTPADPTSTVTENPPVATPTETPPPTTPTPSDNPVVNLPLDATITLSKLPGVIDVAFDSLGQPHIYGSDLRSVIFGQGYETAAVRFWEMDAFRRVAEGRLSELFGELTFGSDVEMRTEFTTRDGRRLEEALWQDLQEVAAETAGLVQAYADGVNAWLDDLRAGRNGATLPPEYRFFLLAQTPADLDNWRPQDTLAIARLQAWSLSETLDAEIGGARRFAALPDNLRRDIYRSAPAAPATVLPRTPTSARGRTAAGTPRRHPPLPSVSILDALVNMRRHNAAFNPLAGLGRDTGSNNWIVSPALSANGHAMLANDPHLALFNPPIWHMIQLDAGDDMRANGVMFPGLPGIILGHNDFGAWGGTVAVFDVTDVYKETVTTPPDYPASPRTVLFNGKQVPVLRIEEPIRIKGGLVKTVVIEVVPHHGPMVPDPNLDDDVEGLAATNMSFRWTGHELSEDPVFVIDLNRARNVEEFKAATRHFAVGAQNWVWADINGDIAYFPHALIPQRPPGTVPYLPMDGTGTAEWLHDGEGNILWLPEDKLPQAVNPPQGWLSTANNDQFGNTLDNDPLNDESYFTFTADIGFREQRVQDLLSNRAGLRPEGAPITLQDMSAYQYDTASLEASRIVPFLLAASSNRPELVQPAMRTALDRLRAWGEAHPGSVPWDLTSGVDPADFRDDLPPRAVPVSDEEKSDSIAASIYAGWITRLGRAVYSDDLSPFGVGNPGGDFAMKGLLHILEDIDRSDPGFRVYTKGSNGESTLWDNRNTDVVETRDQVLLAALSDGLAFLADKFGTPNQEEWEWGKIHQVRFQHFFGQAGIPTFDLGPFPAPGGRESVNPGFFSLNSNNFTFSSGPSERFVIELDPAGVRAMNILPGGNNGNPGAILDFNKINPDIHYGDHIAGWINGKTFEYRTSRQAVAADTQRHLRFVPAE